MAGYPKHLYRSPGPYGVGERSYAIRGAVDEAEEAALIAAGWKASKEEAWGIHPLDHDSDGKKGGSLPGKRRGRPPKVASDE